MANFNLSPNMSLPVPVPGVDPGPDWASNLNASLTILDSHNHATGSGVQINPSGININADLAFNIHNAITLRSARFSPQVSPIPNSGSDIGCLYVSGNELYYNDVSGGHQVQMTSSGSIPGSSGTITGLPSGTASAAYQSVPGTFQFLQATSTAANMDIATLIVRYPGSYPTPSGNYIAIQAPAALSSGFAYTLPASLPSANNAFLTISTAGAMANSVNIDNSSLTIVSNTLAVGVGGVTTAMLATATQNFLQPTGSFVAYGGTSAPTGYLMCDGSAVSRTTYSALYAVLGNAYGYGDNSTTFNVPDFRGQFLRGVTGASANDPDSSGRTAMNTGGNTGNNVGSVQGYQIQSHTHPLTLQASAGANNNPSNGTNAPTVGITTGATGGNETRPINAYVYWLVKT